MDESKSSESAAADVVGACALRVRRSRSISLCLSPISSCKRSNRPSYTDCRATWRIKMKEKQNRKLHVSLNKWCTQKYPPKCVEKFANARCHRSTCYCETDSVNFMDIYSLGVSDCLRITEMLRGLGLKKLENPNPYPKLNHNPKANGMLFLLSVNLT